MRRLCACGCDEEITGRRRNVKYVSHAHAQRASRRRIVAKLRAAGVPAYPGLANLPTATVPTRNSHGDSRTRARSRSGIRISFAKALEAVSGAGLSPHDSLRVKVALLGALSDGQRAQWRQRLETR